MKYNHHYKLILLLANFKSYTTFIFSYSKMEKGLTQTSNIESLPLVVLSYIAKIIFGSSKNDLVNFRLTCTEFRQASLTPNILKFLNLQPLFRDLENYIGCCFRKKETRPKLEFLQQCYAADNPWAMYYLGCRSFFVKKKKKFRFIEKISI